MRRLIQRVLVCGPRVTVALSLLLAMISPPPMAAQGTLEGHWEGTIDRSGNADEIRLDVQAIPGGWKGTIEIVGQVTANLQHVRFEDGTVHFEMRVMSVISVFEGKLEGQRIRGECKEGNSTFKFVLERKSAPEGALSRAPSKRNQPRDVKRGAEADSPDVAGERDRDSVQNSRQGTDYALLFGCDEYDKGWDNLANPVPDVEALADVLRKIYRFKVEVVKNPTRGAIKGKLGEYKLRSFKKHDQLLIFFAGHGTYIKDNDAGYLVARDSLRNDDGMGSYVRYDDLQKWIDVIPCDHIFLILDACFGGTAIKRIGQTRGDDLPKDVQSVAAAISKLENVRTRKILTSGGKGYVEDGPPGKHSPFARILLFALNNYGDEDSYLNLYEVVGKIQKRSNPTKGFEPQFDSFGADEAGDFFFFVKFAQESAHTN